MGAIEPLSNLKWETEEPRKIYKFSPKYFLTMGLTNTNINFITQMDKQYPSRLIERQKIHDTHPNSLKCLPTAVPMVNEIYTFLVTTYLPQRYPTMFTLQSPSHLLNIATNKLLPTSPPQDPIEALHLLSVNIDEDFLMLLPAPDGDGYSLQSFIWCYPVGFDAGSKLGLKLREAHKPVPEYKEKLQGSMDRYFGKLEVGRVVYRVNWAIATNDSLCEDGEYHLYEGQEVSTETDIDISNCWVRCELQTLFALPKSGGRILSVHLYLYPLQQIKDEGLGEELCEAIDGLKLGNAPSFWRYKRAPVWQEKVKEFLRG
ncbi:uncharacterized protein LY89DRAFT_646318 [Mollisia scopiformis]|uniref:Uncharacterized protein n=1 Tax=Mollisia scopiformis TaxID=149040 RepID=A0A194XAF8_MOLSC|nr:uncharacterized protein LY89DRAFT_646318 [Mollisia scopiformis]KUJ17151.1 hypothetical protein LY89DRAFT_646318 [Mollisia scopiformis]